MIQLSVLVAKTNQILDRKDGLKLKLRSAKIITLTSTLQPTIKLHLSDLKEMQGKGVSLIQIFLLKIISSFGFIQKQKIPVMNFAHRTAMEPYGFIPPCSVGALVTLPYVGTVRTLVTLFTFLVLCTLSALCALIAPLVLIP